MNFVRRRKNQQTWHWLCRIGTFLSYMRKDFYYLCHVREEECDEIIETCLCLLWIFSTQSVNSAAFSFLWAWYTTVISTQFERSVTGMQCKVFGKFIFAVLLIFFICDQATLRTLLSVRPPVCLSARPSVTHFHNVPLVVLSWNIQELLPMTEAMSMQKFNVWGQRSRSQRSKPNLTVSGP